MNETMFHILASVANESLPTKDIRERIGALTSGGPPPITSLYRSLATAEEEGWIEVVHTQADTGGRPAQTYRITDEGRRVVRRRAREMRTVADLVLAAERAGDSRS